MTFKRGITYALILSVVGFSLWLLRRRDARRDAHIEVTTLQPSEQAKVVLNPLRHSVTVSTRSGPVKTTFLPPHPVSVTIGKDGKVTIQERQWGTEAAPFIGFSYSDKARLTIGADLLYWHRWEVGLFAGVSVSGGTSVRVGARVAYNLYNNTSLFVGVDNRGTPTGGISWKF